MRNGWAVERLAQVANGVHTYASEVLRTHLRILKTNRSCLVRLGRRWNIRRDRLEEDVNQS
jgi:hypothetical protein